MLHYDTADTYIQKLTEKQPVKLTQVIPLKNAKDYGFDKIYDFLIQETGRFVEQHQSDLLCDIRSVQKSLDELNEPKAFLFGLRELGVDHAAFVFHRLRENQSCDMFHGVSLSRHYRKCYALILRANDDKTEVTAELFDLSGTFLYQIDLERVYIPGTSRT